MDVDFSSYPTNTLLFLVREITKEIKARQNASAAPNKAQERAQRRAKFVQSLKPEQENKRDAANELIFDANCGSLLSVRGIAGPTVEREKYFPALIKQDWSSLYPRDDGPKKFYVYVHVDPSQRCFITTKSCGGNYKGHPFYVGKGTGGRAYDLKRNQGHGKMIRSALDAGFLPSDIVHIPFPMLTEAEAYEIEAKLIYFFRTIYESKKHGCLYNLDIPKVPNFKGRMHKYFSRMEVHNLLQDQGEEQVDEAVAQG